MSGGVDSSVTAALCVEKYGKENVFGLTMKLFCYGEKEDSDKSCCSIDAINDAKSVCNKLGIAHYVINLEKEFEREIIGDFVSEYEKGHTPNPCIRCNKIIKFDYLLKKARELGADRLATGHYSRIEKVASNKYQVSSGVNSLPATYYLLLRGKDLAKDQSYFLYTLSQEQLSHIIFPLGDLEKTEVRKLAEKYELKVAQKPESQDICFVPGSVEDFLEEKASFTPGKIVDKSGKIVGEHRGLAFYTIGQRRGLGGGFSEVMYVIDLDKEKNEVIIGTENELFSDNLVVEDFRWTIDEPKLPFECTAKIRYQAKEAKCIVKASSKGQMANDKLYEINFTEPQKAITPGQSVVFYKGDEVIGGGIIS